MPTTPSSSRRLWLLCPVLFLFALGIRTYHLGEHVFNVDEFTTIRAIAPGFHQMVSERLSVGHPPLYFLTLKGWTRLFGNGDKALLSLSILFGMLSLGYIFLIARHAWGLECALWSLFIAAIHQELIYSSQFVRPYAALLLAAAASVHALMHGLESGRRVWWAQYIAWCVIGILMHVSFLFIFVSQIVTVGAWLALSRRWRKDWAIATAIPTAVIVAIIAVLKHFNATHYATRQSKWTALNRLKDASGIFFGWIDKGLGNPWKAIIVALIVALFIFAYLAARQRPLRSSGNSGAKPIPVFALVVAWTWAVPFGLVLMTITVGGAIVEPRYYIVSVGGACLTLGLGLTYLRRPASRFTLGGVCALLLAATTIAWSHEADNGLREGFQYVTPHIRTKEPIIIRIAEADTMSDFYDVEGPNVFAYAPEREPEILKALSKAADQGAGFWLLKLQYGKERFPLSENLMKIVNSRFQMEKEKIFSNTHVYHYAVAKPKN